MDEGRGAEKRAGSEPQEAEDQRPESWERPREGG